MVNYKFKISSVLVLFTVICFLISFTRLKPMMTQHTETKEYWLSFIPPIEEFSEKQILLPCSLKKINFFNEQELDEQSKIENYHPVIDSVLVIPKRFHFAHE
jgi:hypothetical protein